jgi:hypothetical protein
VDRFEPYRQQAKEAGRLFADACQRRKQADQDMARFRKLATALADMLPDDERLRFLQDLDASSAVGFTDTIKQIYREASPNGVTPMQVRAKLQGAGYDLSGQSNPMASIHSVIRRLLASGHIQPFGNASFGGFSWSHPNPDDDVYKSGMRDWDADQRKRNTPTHTAKTPGEQKRDLEAIRDRYKKR